MGRRARARQHHGLAVTTAPRPHAYRRHPKGTACTVCGNSQGHESHQSVLPNFLKHAGTLSIASEAAHEEARKETLRKRFEARVAAAGYPPVDSSFLAETRKIITGVANFQRQSYRLLQLCLLEQHDQLEPLRGAVQKAEDAGDFEAWAKAYRELRTAENESLAALASYLDLKPEPS